MRRARLARIRPCSWTALWLIALVLVGGCGQSTPASRRVDVSIKQDLLRGVRQIRANPDRKKLHAELVRTLARLRRAHGETAGTRRGRELAIQGFEATLKGVRSELDFDENDSGEVAAATRDAARAQSLPHARRESVTRGRASARRSDRRAQWTLISHPRCRRPPSTSAPLHRRLFGYSPGSNEKMVLSTLPPPLGIERRTPSRVNPARSSTRSDWRLPTLT